MILGISISPRYLKIGVIIEHGREQCDLEELKHTKAWKDEFSRYVRDQDQVMTLLVSLV